MNKLTPNLGVTDIAASVAFYRDILGFSLRMAVPETKDGIDETLDEAKQYVYAMMGYNGIELMLQRIDSLREDVGSCVQERPGFCGTLYFDVEDADALYESIRQKATVIKAPETAWYGMREFYITDPDGYTLGFASQVQEA